ncbi:MAG: DUF3179 domain-containing (seleno)protein [Actinomycetota bacterium]
MRRSFLLVLALLAACGADEAEPATVTERSTADAPIPASSIGVPDRSTAEVALGDVHFDTFDGGSIPLSEADDETILDLVDRIIPLTDPPTVGVDEFDLIGDDELVLAYIGEDGTATAWPHRILNFHEIVNIVVDGRPVLISYCPLCGSGVVFDRTVDGEVLSFGNTSALYENDMVMFDRQTSSYWWQVAGRAIVGERTGQELEVLPSSTVTWEAFRTAHPDALVLSEEVGRRGRYDRDPFTGYADRLDAGNVPFPTSEEAFADGRLPPGALTIAVELDDRIVAVPVEGGAAIVELGSDAHVVIGADGSAVAVRSPDGPPRLSGDRALTQSGAPIAPTGRPLEVLPSISSLWFAVVASQPDVELVLP